MRVELGSARVAQQIVDCVRGRDPAALLRLDSIVGMPVLGTGASRVAVLGPDGVVYKASWNPEDHQFDSEARLFQIIEDYGLAGCPDFWPYFEHRVMAMRRYGPCLLATIPDSVGLYGDVVPENFGLDERGRLVVIDGGSLFLAAGTTPLEPAQAVGGAR